MSILLIDPDETWGPAIAARLLAEDDEVRVLTSDARAWEGRGVYVAAGDVLDPDLVERACTNVRTIVMTLGGKRVPLSLVNVVLEAAPKSGTSRAVVCVSSPDGGLERALGSSGMDYVVLVTGRRGFLPRVTITPEEVAEAVSAADDLAGEPAAVVDLTSEEGRRELRLA